MNAPTPFELMSDSALPTKRMTDTEFATLARCLNIPESVLRAEEAKAWAESVRRGIVGETR